MTDVERRPEVEAEYGTHLQRSKTVWNRWSNWYRMSERDFEPIRNELIAQLGLEDGDRVLELGCGPGVNFGTIREVIGENGHLVAIDYSPKMVKKATTRVEARGGRISKLSAQMRRLLISGDRMMQLSQH